MSKKIEIILKHSLLKDDKMNLELFRNDLSSMVDDLKSSLINDEEDYIFSLACDGVSAAMVLIDKYGEIYINEDARAKLKSLWLINYSKNLSIFIPKFARELHRNVMPILGFNVVDRFDA
jgi:hypothetical protein